jgi:hypothetical protein
VKKILNRYTLSVVCAVLIVIGCTSRKTISAPADSQYLERRATELYEKAPERALALIDSAEQTGTMPNFRADLLRAKLFTLSTANQRQDVALQIAEGLLSHDSVKGNALRQQEVLQLLLNASRMRHDDEQSMRWATQYTNLLNSLGNESAALRTEAEIGLIMTHL